VNSVSVRRIEEVCRGRRLVLARVYDVIRGRTKYFDAILHPGAVAIVAVDGDRVLLERQYRPVVGEWLYEIPAGTLEPGEKPEETARRELEEETGYRPGWLRRLIEFYSSPGMSTEKIIVFLAGNLSRGEQRLEEDELIEVKWVKLDEALEMIRDGRIKDAKTLIGLLYYALARERGWI
jgi:ADP-ribose pyrophosphatase